MQEIGTTETKPLLQGSVILSVHQRSWQARLYERAQGEPARCNKNIYSFFLLLFLVWMIHWNSDFERKLYHIWLVVYRISISVYVWFLGYFNKRNTKYYILVKKTRKQKQVGSSNLLINSRCQISDSYLVRLLWSVCYWSDSEKWRRRRVQYLFKDLIGYSHFF